MGKRIKRIIAIGITAIQTFVSGTILPAGYVCADDRPDPNISVNKAVSMNDTVNDNEAKEALDPYYC